MRCFGEHVKNPAMTSNRKRRKSTNLSDWIRCRENGSRATAKPCIEHREFCLDDFVGNVHPATRSIILGFSVSISFIFESNSKRFILLHQQHYGCMLNKLGYTIPGLIVFHEHVPGDAEKKNAWLKPRKDYTNLLRFHQTKGKDLSLYPC